MKIPDNVFGLLLLGVSVVFVVDAQEPERASMTRLGGSMIQSNYGGPRPDRSVVGNNDLHKWNEDDDGVSAPVPVNIPRRRARNNVNDDDDDDDDGIPVLDAAPVRDPRRRVRNNAEHDDGGIPVLNAAPVHGPRRGLLLLPPDDYEPVDDDIGDWVPTKAPKHVPIQPPVYMWPPYVFMFPAPPNPYDDYPYGTMVPTKKPTKKPTKTPTRKPTKKPTKSPTKVPTKVPTKGPAKAPTRAPSIPVPILVGKSPLGQTQLPPGTTKAPAFHVPSIIIIKAPGGQQPHTNRPAPREPIFASEKQEPPTYCPNCM